MIFRRKIAYLIYIVLKAGNNTTCCVLNDLLFLVENLRSLIAFLTFIYVWYNNRMFSAGILVISDKGSRGERGDDSGPVVKECISQLPVVTSEYAIVPDEKEAIASILKKWVDKRGLDIIFTSGGTGLSPRDVTPEATLAIIDRVVPGMVEAIRMETMKKKREAILSRAVAGIRGKCLIINLPGSPGGVRECLDVILPVLLLLHAKNDIAIIIIKIKFVFFILFMEVSLSLIIF